MVRIQDTEIRTHHTSGKEHLLPLLYDMGCNRYVSQRGWSISASCWMFAHRYASSIQMHVARLASRSSQHLGMCKPVTQDHFLYWYILLYIDQNVRESSNIYSRIIWQVILGTWWSQDKSQDRQFSSPVSCVLIKAQPWSVSQVSSCLPCQHSHSWFQVPRDSWPLLYCLTILGVVQLRAQPWNSQTLLNVGLSWRKSKMCLKDVGGSKANESITESVRFRQINKHSLNTGSLLN
jgi:hypothetical protein